VSRAFNADDIKLVLLCLYNSRAVQMMQPRSGLQGETGLCALHNRRRKVDDLCPLPGQPGQFRCLPRRECFQRDAAQVENVVCAIHGRRRLRYQCHQVADNVFECLPSHQCRGLGQVGAAAPGRPYADQPAGLAPTRAEPAASNFRVAAAGQGRGVPQQMSSVGFGVTALEGSAAEVWCAVHGKKLPQAYCQQHDAAYFACVDGSACTAGTLEAAPTLLAKGCDRLVCSTHGRLRRTRFMALGEDGTSYNCGDDHACAARRRHRTEGEFDPNKEELEQ
jgi:hypothetical protein